MDLHNLKPAAGSVKKRKRIGRGQGSGHGGTATRGNKGAWQRSGTKLKRGFEGGQMPLQRRIPKFGFKNPFRKTYQVVNLSRLQQLADKYQIQQLDAETLVQLGAVKKPVSIKVLGKGKLTAALQVRVHAVSESARKAIEAAGGAVEIV
ncbi:MAG: 50S ribosomal protein L15 [Chitinophagales bacterium]|nr:50S ribosomal protein L15 [Chitinophagales bacterium]MDW8427544.1 50S ribosomal protein L15 [Chitinophagales bacterium]